MCSNLESDLEFQQSLPTKEVDSRCKRCQNPGIVLLRGFDSYCKECFLVYVSHKFCSTIGKMRAVRHGDKVLIAMSGGISSTTMVHLVKESMDKAGSQRRLIFQPTVLFISEAAISPSSVTEKERVQAAQSLCQNYELPFVWSPIEEWLLESPTLYSEYGEFAPTERRTKLQEMFSSSKSATAKEDLTKRIRTELIVKIARKLEHPKVFVGTSSSKLAADLLSSVAQGRGAQLPFEVGFSDNHFGDVTIIRPMREILEDEIEKYVEHRGIASIPGLSQPDTSSRLSSINRLTHDFLSSLQKDFPGTVPTVFRTGDKLTTVAKVDSDVCSFCKMNLDNLHVPASSALQARLYSSALSKLGKSAKQEEIQEMAKAKYVQQLDGIDCSKLCYGCSLTIKDLS